ncbi:MAG: IS5 family transposase [Geminicoccaceae bacterium]
MPYKFQEPRRHHFDKMTFKVTNWSAYDEGLRNRGSLTFWVEDDVLQSWYAAPRTTRGGQPIYADGTIEMILTLGMVYHLPLRQTEGLARSVLSLMDLSLRVPRHSTLSRRRKMLDIQPIKPSAQGPTDIVLDGSGLKVFGAGEWCAEKHGKSRRRWRKLSIGLDLKSGEIVAHKLTDSDVGDPDLVEPLLQTSGTSIRHFFADGAFDGEPVYETVRRYQSGDSPAIIIPPRRTATLSGNADGPTERDRHITMIQDHGRMAWQKATDYGRRSLVETAIGRYKSVIGDSLNARDDDAQVTEVAIAIKALNRMIRAAKPISVRA